MLFYCIAVGGWVGGFFWMRLAGILGCQSRVGRLACLRAWHCSALHSNWSELTEVGYFCCLSRSTLQAVLSITGVQQPAVATLFSSL